MVTLGPAAISNRILYIDIQKKKGDVEWDIPLWRIIIVEFDSGFPLTRPIFIGSQHIIDFQLGIKS